MRVVRTKVTDGGDGDWGTGNGDWGTGEWGDCYRGGGGKEFPTTVALALRWHRGFYFYLET